MHPTEGNFKLHDYLTRKIHFTLHLFQFMSCQRQRHPCVARGLKLQLGEDLVFLDLHFNQHFPQYCAALFENQHANFGWTKKIITLNYVSR